MHYTPPQTFLLIEPAVPQQKAGQIRKCKESIPVTQREMYTLDVHERHKYDFCNIPHHSVPVINIVQIHINWYRNRLFDTYRYQNT